MKKKRSSPTTVPPLKNWLDQTRPGLAYRRYRRNRQGDVFLISFPKCGRTWLQTMLARVFVTRFDQQPPADPTALGVVTQKITGVPVIKVMHDDNPHRKRPDQLIATKEEYRSRKVIFLARDPRDAMVSWFFFRTQRRHNFAGDLDSFLKMECGSTESLLRFYNIWADQRHVPTAFLLTRYEDLHLKPLQELEKIFAFLGIDGITESILQEAITFSSFDQMHKLESSGKMVTTRLRTKTPSDPHSYMTREGKIGGHRRHMTPQQIQWVNQKMKKELSDFYGYPMADPA